MHATSTTRRSPPLQPVAMPASSSCSAISSRSGAVLLWSAPPRSSDTQHGARVGPSATKRPTLVVFRTPRGRSAISRRSRRRSDRIVQPWSIHLARYPSRRPHATRRPARVNPLRRPSRRPSSPRGSRRLIRMFAARQADAPTSSFSSLRAPRVVQRVAAKSARASCTRARTPGGIARPATVASQSFSRQSTARLLAESAVPSSS